MPLVELAGHGDEHLNTMEDLSRGLKKLRGWLVVSDGTLLNTDICGIASPNSNLTADEITGNKKLYEDMGVEYVRIGPGTTYSGVRRIEGKLSRMTGSDGLFWKSNKGISEHFEGAFVVHSVPVMKPHTLSQVKRLVEENISRGTDIALMFHSIVKRGEEYYDDTWSYDYDDFLSLADWLIGREDCFLQTMRDAVRGQMIREA